MIFFISVGRFQRIHPFFPVGVLIDTDVEVEFINCSRENLADYNVFLKKGLPFLSASLHQCSSLSYSHVWRALFSGCVLGLSSPVFWPFCRVILLLSPSSLEWPHSGFHFLVWQHSPPHHHRVPLKSSVHGFSLDCVYINLCFQTDCPLFKAFWENLSIFWPLYFYPSLDLLRQFSWEMPLAPNLASVIAGWSSSIIW